MKTGNHPGRRQIQIMNAGLNREAIAVRLLRQERRTSIARTIVDTPTSCGWKLRFISSFNFGGTPKSFGYRKDEWSALLNGTEEHNMGAAVLRNTNSGNLVAIIDTTRCDGLPVGSIV